MKKFSHLIILSLILSALSTGSCLCPPENESFFRKCKLFFKYASPLQYRKEDKYPDQNITAKFERLKTAEGNEDAPGWIQEETKDVWRYLHKFHPDTLCGKTLQKINPNRRYPKVVLTDAIKNAWALPGYIFLQKSIIERNRLSALDTIRHETMHCWQGSSYPRYIYWLFINIFRGPEEFRYGIEYQANEKKMDYLYNQKNYVGIYQAVGKWVFDIFPEGQNKEQRLAILAPYRHGTLDSFFRNKKKGVKDEEIHKIFDFILNGLQYKAWVAEWSTKSNEEFIKNVPVYINNERVDLNKLTEAEIEDLKKEGIRQNTTIVSAQDFENWQPKSRRKRFREHLENSSNVPLNIYTTDSSNSQDA